MKKIFLPLIAALAITACEADVNTDGKDGSDANDSVEKKVQDVGADVKAKIEEMDNFIDSNENAAGARTETGAERADRDSLDRR